MAITPYGILGPLHGKVGPVTSYLRNGVTVVRIATRRKDKANTTARLAQREKLRLCNTFTRAFTGTAFFKATFPPYGHTGTGLHRATSALMNRAVRGTYPALSLSYPDILISKGPLPGAVNPHATADSNRQITFTWHNNSDTGTAAATDNTITVVFDTANHEALFSLKGNSRAAQSTIMDASLFNGRTVATWLSFINDNGDVADSVFCGMLALP